MGWDGNVHVQVTLMVLHGVTLIMGWGGVGC